MTTQVLAQKELKKIRFSTKEIALPQGLVHLQVTAVIDTWKKLPLIDPMHSLHRLHRLHGLLQRSTTTLTSPSLDC